MNPVTKLRVLYPIWVLLGIFSVMYIPSAMIDMKDVAKTIQNISGNLFLFRLGIIGRLLTQLLYILIPFLLYGMFKKQDKDAATLMLVLALVSVPIAMISESLNIQIITDLSAPEKVRNMLALYSTIINIAIIFWGLWLLPLGYLVYNSNAFPKIIGICLQIAGVGYFIGAFNTILFPDFEMLKSVSDVMTIGEMIFILWFVVRGQNKSASLQYVPEMKGVY